MIAAGLAIVAALVTASTQERAIEPGVSVPLDKPMMAYAYEQLRDAKAAVAARKLNLTCLSSRDFKGKDSCDEMRALFRVMDQREFITTFVGPCYGGAPSRCISLQHRRNSNSYFDVMIRLEPSDSETAGKLRMASVEIAEGQYTSD